MEPMVKIVSGMDKYLSPADRGYVYEFLEPDGVCNDKYCLVVSSQKRAYDNIISILILQDSRAGLDVVKCNFQGKTKYVHCGLVTYLKRERLGTRVCPFPKKGNGYGRPADSKRARSGQGKGTYLQIAL